MLEKLTRGEASRAAAARLALSYCVGREKGRALSSKCTRHKNGKLARRRNKAGPLASK
jgi:hypothetical protein